MSQQSWAYDLNSHSSYWSELLYKIWGPLTHSLRVCLTTGACMCRWICSLNFLWPFGNEQSWLWFNCLYFIIQYLSHCLHSPTQQRPVLFQAFPTNQPQLTEHINKKAWENKMPSPHQCPPATNTISCSTTFPLSVSPSPGSQVHLRKEGAKELETTGDIPYWAPTVTSAHTVFQHFLVFPSSPPCFPHAEIIPDKSG